MLWYNIGHKGQLEAGSHVTGDMISLPEKDNEWQGWDKLVLSEVKFLCFSSFLSWGSAPHNTEDNGNQYLTA